MDDSKKIPLSGGRSLALSQDDRNLRIADQNGAIEIEIELRETGPVVRVRAAALQYVRKISGYNKPSKANEAAFNFAVEAIAAISADLLRSLETTTPPKNRDEEASKARLRSAQRFGK